MQRRIEGKQAASRPKVLRAYPNLFILLDGAMSSICCKYNNWANGRFKRSVKIGKTFDI